MRDPAMSPTPYFFEHPGGTASGTLERPILHWTAHGDGGEAVHHKLVVGTSPLASCNTALSASAWSPSDVHLSAGGSWKDGGVYENWIDNTADHHTHLKRSVLGRGQHEGLLQGDPRLVFRLGDGS
jgi:hypothetical protein